MRARPIGFALLALFPLMQAACSGGRDSGSQAQIIPIKGDPLTFIAGTARDHTSGWDLSQIKTDNEHAVILRVYRTVEQRTPQDFNQVMQEQAPETTQPTDESIRLVKMKWESFTPINASSESETRHWRVFSDQNAFPDITFREEQGRLHFSSLSFTGYPNALFEDVTVQHYSQKQDGTAHSLLLSFSERVSGRRPFKYLYDFTIYPLHSQPLLNSMVSSVYNYLFGPGVAVRWKQAPNLTICELGDVAYADTIEAAVAEWTAHLPQEFQSPPRRLTQACPPFSDLNSQNVFLVRGWTEIARRDIVNLAWVLPVANFESSDFIDSDMMIMDNEFRKLSPTRRGLSDPGSSQEARTLERFDWVIRHELGHTFGLHHEFEEQSVMGYNHDFTELQSHDVRAVQTLYGPSEPRTSVEEDQG